MNPIAEILDEIMERLGVTKEQLCVQCKLRYHTLDNVWKRNRVSYVTLKSLRFGNVITDEQAQEYESWVKEQ